MSTERLCLYCGNPTGKVRRGDHLVPHAIGGTIATKDVCPTCNNNVLSDIDRELCSRSPLCLVAAGEIQGFVAQAWDVDDQNENLLLEGRPDFANSSFTIFPQMIVTPHGEQFRADWKELRDFGTDKFQFLFTRRLRKALSEYEGGNKRALIFSPIEYNEELLTHYTYLPRFFVRGSVAEACSNKTIELRYISEGTKRFALARIASGLNQSQEMRTQVRLGSSLPTIRCFFDAGKVWRALAKIAVNLLHHYCRQTEVNRNGFRRVIAEIIGERPFGPARLARSGFVCYGDVATIASEPKSHSFRLCWEDGWWNAAMAFFGGQIGAAVKFPGPNKEPWRMLDITAPMNSSRWKVSPSSLIVPAKFSVEWLDLNKIISRGGFVELGAERCT
jgi:HNH endonuclease